ncbi:MAG: transcription elongation factor GreA [Spirochaetaceae bacterium]|jgi:transcription elongation factor GreA|nr:transcription elongation factor GreA [Spirochaetaceae bacterium]
MSSDILNNVQKMLNEEKFTRAALSNYSTAQFKELDEILDAAGKEHCLDELKTLCDEHLSHSKNSIIAEYFSGLVSLSRQIIDDVELVNLVNIFVDNHKGNIVKYLSERMLDYGESKFALRTLGDCYKSEGKEAELYDVWKRLVKIDYEEADIAKNLADHAEKEGNFDESVDYYRKALNRYINKQLFTNVREIWQKLLEYLPEEIDYFLHLQKRVAKNISPEKAELLLWDLYHLCRKKNDIETAILVLKQILDYDEKDKTARKGITECFRIKYAKHSQLEEYIKVSNLAQDWRNVHEAILDFEKHIAFDKGNFVFHKTWGVGRISNVTGDEIAIDFAKKRAHEMSLKMAVNALQTLAKDHIWTLKARKTKEELHAKVKENIAWALKTVIRSFSNRCSIKQIKAELVPSVLAAGEWTTWNTKAKAILEHDPMFGNDPYDIDVYMVRERPISMDEKLYNEFKAERKFFKRVAILRKFIKQTEAGGDSDFFTEMLDYLTGFLKASNLDTTNHDNKVQLMASYLIIKNLSKELPELAPNLTLNFNEIYESFEKASAVYAEIKYDDKEEADKEDAGSKEGGKKTKDSYDLQRDFLKQIKELIPGWQDEYIKLFAKVVAVSKNKSNIEFVLHSLEEAGESAKIVSLIRNCFENYKEARAAVVWFYNNYRDKSLYKEAGLSEEKEIITLIHVMDITFREIDNHRNTSENKKINKQAQTILFEKLVLVDYIKNADRDNVERIYTLVEDVQDLDPSIKQKLQRSIKEKYADFKFAGISEKRSASRTLFVTAAKYTEKQKQLADIMEVQVPQNSKEIAFALSLGDLRENAEYKAAKEKQEMLNSQVVKLKSEIERASIFDPATIDTGHVSFATTVTLDNKTTARQEIYTILGPWESDPDNKIISYLSPLGEAMINKRVGDKFDFSIGAEKNLFEVKEISAADI